jgi:hypothetical protein
MTDSFKSRAGGDNLIAIDDQVGIQVVTKFPGEPTCVNLQALLGLLIEVTDFSAVPVILARTEFQQQVNKQLWNTALLAALCGMQGHVHGGFLS